MSEPAKTNKVVITYGTFDLMHEGHLRLLERAKKLGDYLIVGVTSDSYDLQRGKLNVQQPLSERMRAVEATGIADLVIVEEYEGQKVEDIAKYGVDVFAIGSDWKGHFDYLKEHCEVVYLERTKGVSSTQLRGIVQIGIVGSGRIASRFVSESRYVSGAVVDRVYNPNPESAERFALAHELEYGTADWDRFIHDVDAVYVASPHLSHYDYARQALEAGKHALVEKPMVLRAEEARHLFDLARKRNLVLLEAIKTAYAPAFRRILGLAKSHAVGKVRHVEATFTKLVTSGRELDPAQAGGAMTELGSYVLLPFVKLCGGSPKDVEFRSMRRSAGDVDLWTQVVVEGEGCLATLNAGLGIKSEGDLIISGTEGYIYVPAPWWKPTLFEVRRENPSDNERFCDVFSGDGLRYELAHFLQMIAAGRVESHLLSPSDSVAIAAILEQFLQGDGVRWYGG